MVIKMSNKKVIILTIAIIAGMIIKFISNIMKS